MTQTKFSVENLWESWQGVIIVVRENPLVILPYAVFLENLCIRINLRDVEAIPMTKSSVRALSTQALSMQALSTRATSPSFVHHATKSLALGTTQHPGAVRAERYPAVCHARRERRMHELQSQITSRSELCSSNSKEMRRARVQTATSAPPSWVSALSPDRQRWRGPVAGWPEGDRAGRTNGDRQARLARTEAGWEGLRRPCTRVQCGSLRALLVQYRAVYGKGSLCGVRFRRDFTSDSNLVWLSTGATTPGGRTRAIQQLKRCLGLGGRFR